MLCGLIIVLRYETACNQSAAFRPGSISHGTDAAAATAQISPPG